MDKNKIKQTVIIIMLIFIPFLLFPENPVETLEMLEKQLAAPISSGSEKLRLLTQLCELAQDNEPEKAVKYGKKALEILQQSMDPSLEIRVLLSLTWATQSIGEYETALEHGYKAETLALEIGDKKAAAAAYNHISRVYYLLGFLDHSFEYALRVLESVNEPRDHKNIAEAYKNFGNVYRARKDNNQALDYYRNSLNIMEELGDKKSIARVLINIGNVYHASRQYKKALKYYLESRDIVEKLNWKMGRAAALYSIAAVRADTGEPAAALDYDRKALEICKEIGQKRNIAILLGHIGTCHRRLEKYKKALHFVRRALNIAKAIKCKDIINHLYKELANIYVAKKDYTQAYTYFKLYKARDDEIFSEDYQKDISGIRHRYKKIKEEKARLELDLYVHNNHIQKLQLERQEWVRNSLIVVSLLALAMAFVIYNRYRTKKRAGRLLEESERKLRVMNTAKDKLFSIIAHDLESPLNGLLLSSGYLEKNYHALEKEKIKAFLHEIYENTHHIAKLLDNLLQWAMSQLGKLEVNLETLDLSRLAQDTIELLEPSAREKNIRLLSHIKKNTLARADERMVETIMRNLVSNAVKYSSAGGKVQIYSKSNGNFLEVTVSDTGVGIPIDKLNTLFNPGVRSSTRGTAGEKGIGLGLVLCKEFVEKNGGTIRVENNKSNETQPGTRMIFTLPAVHGVDRN